MNDTMILELKNYVLSDEGKSNQINEVGNELVLAFETLTTMLLHFEGRARPDELLQMNNAIGDSLQLLEPPSAWCRDRQSGATRRRVARELGR